MALTVGELNAIMTVDDRAVDPGLRRVERAMRESGQQMGDEADRAGREAGTQLGQGLVRGADGQWRDMGGNLVDAVTAAAAEAESAAHRAGQQAGRAVGEGITEGGTEGADQAAESIGTRLRDRMSLMAAGAGVALGAVLMDSFSQALDQGRITAVATAGLADTPAQAQRYGQAAGRLFKDAVVTNFEEGMGSITAIAKSGLVPPDATVAQLTTIGTKVSDLSTKYGEETSSVVRAAQKLLATGLAGSANEAFDLIAKGFTTSANQGEDFLDTLNEYSVQFKRVGLDGQTSIGLISQAISAGARDSDQVADAIGQFGEKAVAGGKPVEEAFKSIGLSSDTVAGKLKKGGKSGQQALQMTLDALRGTKDETVKLNAATALFGDPGTVMGDALFAMDPAGAAAASGMDKASGSVGRLGKEMRDNAGTQLTQFKNTMQQNLVEFLGGTVIPGLMKFVSFVRDHQGEFKAFATVIATVVVPALTVLGGRALWAGAQMARAWIMGLGPVAWVAAGIAALVVLVIAYWDEIVAATSAVWGWVVDKLKWAKDAAISAFMNFTLVGLLIKHWGAIKSGALTAWNGLVKWLKGVPGMIYNAFLNFTPIGLIIKHWSSIKTATVKKALEMVAWVRGLPGRISKAIGSLGSLLTEKGNNVVQGLWSGIQSMGGWIKSKLISWAKDVIPGPIAKALGISSPSKVTTAQGRWIARGLIDGLTGSTKQVKAASGKLADIIADSLKPGKKRSAALAKLGTGTRQLLALAKREEAIAARLKTSTKRLDDLRQAREKLAADVAKGVMDSANITSQDTGGWPQTAESILAGLRTDTLAAQRFAKNLAALRKKGVRSDLISQIAQAGVDGGSSAAAALANANSGQVKQINSQQAALVRAANQAGTTAGDAMYGAGIRAAQGLVRGLRSQQTAIERQMLTIARGMSKAIRAALGIKSPSRVMALVGRYTAQGLIKGVEGERSAVNRSMASLVETPAAGSYGSGYSAGMAGRRQQTKVVLELKSSGRGEDNYLIERLRRGIRVNGGKDVNLVLGGNRSSG